MTEPSSSECPPSAAGECGLHCEYRWIRRALMATLAISCAVAFGINLVDPDLWGHVKYGQEVLAEGKLPETATHTYTADGYRWINHENLSEIVFAYVYERLGVRGLTVGKCLLGLAILGLMWWTARRRLGAAGTRLDPLAMWAFLFLVTLNLATFFPVRPQLFSFALCALMLVLLDLAFGGGPARRAPKFAWLWCLPPVLVVWVNFHGGFVAGLCILLAYLVGRGLEMLLWARFGQTGPDEALDPTIAAERGSATVSAGTQLGASLGERCPLWKRICHMAVVGAVCAATVLVNPYGLKLPLWLAESLWQPRPEVTEWAMLRTSDPVFVPFVLLCLLVALAIALGKRPRDWTQTIVLALVAWQAVAHVRHVAFFAVLCGFWLPGMLAGLADRVRNRQSDRLPDIVLAPWLRRAALAALALVFALQAYNLAGRVRELPVYRNFYPVDAVEYMAAQGLKGRLVASFNWAQYALAALTPEIELQFDGRYDTCYPPRAIDWHFDFLLGEHEGRRFRFPESGPLDGTNVLREGDPDLVLVDRAYPAAIANMQRELAERPDQWILLYQDGIAQLYGRRERYDDPRSSHYVPEPYRVVSDVTREDYVAWPALPARGLSRFAAK